MSSNLNAARRRDAALLAISSSLGPLERSYRAAANRAVAHVGLSQALAWPLVMIGRRGGEGIRQGVLAEQLGIEGPSLARSIEQLVLGGFVNRREDSDDRRARILHITDAGSRACEQIESALADMRKALYASVPDEDLLACLRVFGALREQLGCSPFEPPAAKQTRRSGA